MHAAAIERHIADIANAIGGVLHIGIDGAQAREIECGVREHPARGRACGLLRRRGLDTLDRLGGTFRGRQADQRPQVVHVHDLGVQRPTQLRHLLRLIEIHRPLDVGKPQLALEALDLPGHAVLHDATAHRIGRSVRQRHAQQSEQLSKTLSAQREIGTDAVESFQRGDRPGRLQPGLAGGGVDLQRKRWGRRRGFRQLQHVAGASLGRQRLVLVGSLDAVIQRHVAPGIVEIHIGMQVHAQVLGQEIHRALVDLHLADFRRVLFFRRVLAESPGPPTVGFHLEAHRGR